MDWPKCSSVFLSLVHCDHLKFHQQLQRLLNQISVSFFTSSLPESRGSATLRSKSLYDTGDKFFASRRIDRQKVVTFFRESDSEEPELRIIIDARKYTNLEMLIDELSRILSLRDREKNIYNQSGRILRRVEDFEDGASYFFSFSANDERFMQALSVVNNGSEVTKYFFMFHVDMFLSTFCFDWLHFLSQNEIRVKSSERRIGNFSLELLSCVSHLSFL